MEDESWAAGRGIRRNQESRFSNRASLAYTEVLGRGLGLRISDS